MDANKDVFVVKRNLRVGRHRTASILFEAKQHISEGSKHRRNRHNNKQNKNKQNKNKQN